MTMGHEGPCTKAQIKKARGLDVIEAIVIINPRYKEGQCRTLCMLGMCHQGMRAILGSLSLGRDGKDKLSARYDDACAFDPYSNHKQACHIWHVLCIVFVDALWQVQVLGTWQGRSMTAEVIDMLS